MRWSVVLFITTLCSACLVGDDAEPMPSRLLVIHSTEPMRQSTPDGTPPFLSEKRAGQYRWFDKGQVSAIDAWTKNWDHADDAESLIDLFDRAVAFAGLLEEAANSRLRHHVDRGTTHRPDIEILSAIPGISAVLLPSGEAVAVTVPFDPWLAKAEVTASSDDDAHILGEQQRCGSDLACPRR